jgi:hypothetical protein
MENLPFFQSATINVTSEATARYGVPQQNPLAYVSYYAETSADGLSSRLFTVLFPWVKTIFDLIALYLGFILIAFELTAIDVWIVRKFLEWLNQFLDWSTWIGMSI